MLRVASDASAAPAIQGPCINGTRGGSDDNRRVALTHVRYRGQGVEHVANQGIYLEAVGLTFSHPVTAAPLDIQV